MFKCELCDQELIAFYKNRSAIEAGEPDYYMCVNVDCGNHLNVISPSEAERISQIMETPYLALERRIADLDPRINELEARAKDLETDIIVIKRVRLDGFQAKLRFDDRLLRLERMFNLGDLPDDKKEN